jgi:hypothetical protein
MKVSYWHIIKEKEFNDWLESFDFDREHKSSKRMQFADAIEYEIFIHHLDLIIKWVVNYKEYNDDMGGCITKILMYTWENGFSNRSKSIKIEKWGRIKVGKSNITIGTFVKLYDKGTYIVTVRGHAFSIKDGVVVGGNREDAKKMRCILEGAWKIGN